jgi:hypothetical protein
MCARITGEAGSFFTEHHTPVKQLLPEAGHLSWSDQPEMFASMISDWTNDGHKTVGHN